jgi:glycosyltransferase involved in cell wall biosynthesis
MKEQPAFNRGKARFVVNLSSVAAYPTGLGSYSRRILGHLIHRYDCTVMAPPHVELPTGIPRIETPLGVAIGDSGNPVARVLGLMRRQAFYLRGPIRADDFVYSPTHHGFWNTRNQVITIHDLISLHYPENFPRQAKFFRLVMPKLIAQSRAVFVVSEFTKEEVCRFFECDQRKIFVVPNIFDFVSLKGEREIVNKNFLLVVGCHLPHKNIDEILRFAPLWSNKFRLKIIGAKGDYGAKVRIRVTDLGLDDVVDFLPFVSEEELDQLYREASALLYPSNLEGFGLPPLEALARGTLSIVSDIAVHREVMGDAALFIQLGDEASWSTAISSIATFDGAAMLSPTRRIVLSRYSAQEVGRQLDEALLSAMPELRRFLR